MTGIAVLLALPFFLPRGEQATPHLASGQTLQRWAPRLLILTLLVHVIGFSAHVYYDLHFDYSGLAWLAPSWFDLACMSAHLLLLLAILLLPSQPLPTEKRLQVALDGLMIMVGVITFSWYFILGPTILKGATTLAGRITNTAYPLTVLLQIFCLLLLTLRTRDQTMRPTVLILSLALAILALTDSIFAYQMLHNLYTPGEVLDTGWAASDLLIGLTARTIYLSLRSTSLPPQQGSDTALSSPLLWHSLLPYLLIPPVILLMAFISYMGENSALKPGVSIGAMTLVGLLVLRQIFTIRGAVAQNNELRRMQQDLHKNNHELKQANGQLEQQARQLERAYEQLSHLSKLREQFIANINHELRTPLTQIDGYLDLLSEYQGRLDEATQANFIQHAKEGSQELLLLINTILDALRLESEIRPPRMEDVALSPVVSQVCQQFPQASRLCMDIPPSLGVKADQQYLRQVLRNLLSNALKYSPAEAAVTIRAQLVDRGGSSVACISVQDAGPGIPPEEQDSLFQKFVRLRRDISGPIRGTGLGLYMCKQLVEAMNGEIWVESSGKEGEGSRFCFTLPQPAA
jgi:signal transduction histidine kinase